MVAPAAWAGAARARAPATAARDTAARPRLRMGMAITRCSRTITTIENGVQPADTETAVTFPELSVAPVTTIFWPTLSWLTLVAVPTATFVLAEVRTVRTSPLGRDR